MALKVRNNAKDKVEKKSKKAKIGQGEENRFYEVYTAKIREETCDEIALVEQHFFLKIES